MKTLKESLFDDDLVTKEIHIDVQRAVDMVCNHIEKKFGVKCVEDSKFANVDHYKPGIYSYWSGLWEKGVLDMSHIRFYKAGPFPKLEHHLVGVAVSICISNEDDGVNLSRVDVGHIVDSGSRWPQYGWSCLWNGNDYKRHSKLKSTLFNSKNIDKLFKYIDKLCQAVLDYPVDVNKSIDLDKFYF